MDSAVEAVIAAVADPGRRADALALCEAMTQASGEPAAVLTGSIIGFGRYHYRYDSGREGESCRIGFAPRKTETVLYLAEDFPEREALLARLGRHRSGKACIYVKRLDDLDRAVLDALLRASLAATAARWPD
ncbi:DUF1801 domain-containing protein [Sphingomonas sp. S1-29]|uniref:DUF1801 domain-containing protein n=1 Tax=Sphingomonas sp. S1-29 TaxID=2991074 RepID=UPI00223F5F69|nr:DUF1801 domain-containing protein [Sphingomonas sp. S1-29]UZK68591.1 DUF1801 domain-containing protein [Sphingomonas sp. S1-29]